MKVTSGKREIEDSFHLTYHFASKPRSVDYDIPLGNTFKIVIDKNKTKQNKILIDIHMLYAAICTLPIYHNFHLYYIYIYIFFFYYLF